MLAIIAVVIVAIVAGLYFYMDWQRNRPGAAPAEIDVTAHAGENEATTRPFSVCEFGEECPEGDVAPIDVAGTDNVRISVPREVAQQQWSVLSIYDDPAANSERTFTPGEAEEVDVPVKADGAEGEDAPRLVVVEVSTLLIGQDEAGEETPVITTWAFSTENA